MKDSMFNEYEAIEASAVDDFKHIDSYLKIEIKKLSEKYRLVEIEHYLMQCVSCECSEQRLINAMAMKQERKQKRIQELKNERELTQPQA